MILTKEQLHDALVERHGADIQAKLDKACVGIAGLGGLGSNLAIFLARLGVGHLILVDFDVVDITNLNRQHYTMKDLGIPKTLALVEQLEAINPYLTYETYTERVVPSNVERLFSGCDVVVEAFDRSSRTVPFLSKATGVPMADIATRVILGHSLREQGITEVYGRERSRWFVKAPAFSFAKIRGMESYLSPEMKSTGEAIGYDNKLTRALYKALQSSGMTVANYGTIFLTIADKDKQDALPLVRRFYDLGFNIEATKGTAEFLRQHGIRTRTRRKLSEGSTEIIDSLRQGHVSYVINTIDINQHNTRLDGYEIRRTAVENNVTIFTALETVKVLLDVLEEITLGVSTIDAE